VLSLWSAACSARCDARSTCRHLRTRRRTPDRDSTDVA
jgi:hypothetical protein